MSKKILISNVLPVESRRIVPAEIEVDYNDSDQVLPKTELIRRLQGAEGLVCHILSTVDEEVLAANGAHQPCRAHAQCRPRRGVRAVRGLVRLDAQPLRRPAKARRGRASPARTGGPRRRHRGQSGALWSVARSSSAAPT